MRKLRKEQLIGQFPPMPCGISETIRNGDIFGKSRAANFCVFLTEGKELFVRCFHKYSHSYEVAETQRYVFAKDGYVRYGYNYEKSIWYAMPFREPVFYRNMFGHDTSYTVLNATAIYNSDMRYSQLLEWGGNSSDCMISYLRLYIKHPNIEYLVKSGYANLIFIETESYSGRGVDVDYCVNGDRKSNNLLKMLNLTKSEFKLLQGNEKCYVKYHITRNKIPYIKPEDIFRIAKSEYYADDLLKYSKATGFSVMRIFNYIEGNGIVNYFYRDYIEQCQKLHYDLTDTAIAFPNDFHTVHMRYSKIIQYMISINKRQQFERLIEERKAFEFEYGNLILRQPTSPEEIILEGKTLCHCVGGYAERHSCGTTNIFFIRKKSDPDTPFFTIEVSNNFKIMQCHGYKNDKDTSKPEEVKDFEEKYKEHLEELRHERNNVKSA